MKKLILALATVFAAASLQAGEACCKEKCDAAKNTAKAGEKACDASVKTAETKQTKETKTTKEVKKTKTVASK